MNESRGFSMETVRRANVMMMLGMKSESNIDEKLSRDDIKRAWQKASMKVFGASKRLWHEAF